MVTDRRLDEVETKIKEAMTPKAWIALLADEMAESTTILQFVGEMLKSSRPEEASFYKPQKIFERMGVGARFKRCRDMAYEYRRLATTMLNVNLEVFQHLEREHLVLENLQLRDLHIKIMNTAGSMFQEEDMQPLRQAFTAQTQEIAIQALEKIRATASAIDTFAREHLEGRHFIPRTVQERIRGIESLYAALIDGLSRFLPSTDHVASSTVKPTDEIVQHIIDQWLFEGENTARKLIYHDEKGVWERAQDLFHRTPSIGVLFSRRDGA